MYRTVENLLNMSRFKAKSKITTISVMKFQYANDALVFLSEEELQGFLDAFGKAYKQSSLALNIKKTQILYQPPPNKNTTFLPPAIHVDNTKLENADSDFHNSAAFSPPKANIDIEINPHLSCASTSFARLRKRVF